MLSTLDFVVVVVVVVVAPQVARPPGEPATSGARLAEVKARVWSTWRVLPAGGNLAKWPVAPECDQNNRGKVNCLGIMATTTMRTTTTRTTKTTTTTTTR